MTLLQDRELTIMIAGVAALLVVASVAGWIVGRMTMSAAARATVDNINARVRAWWVMAALFVVSVSTGGGGSIVLFSLISFLALREFVTLAPTRPADHRALFWAFFVVTPVQYYLVWIGWYGLFSMFIPVYVSIFIATRTALAGDTERFLERTAVNQWGLMICVYFISHVPAVLALRIPGYEGQTPKLMFYLVLVAQLSDVLQYVWGKTLGKTPVAPSISPNKTWEGLAGGVVCACVLGTGLWWVSPFSPLEAAVMSLVITVMGFAGGLIMSAIKRDCGVKDYGALIAGHGGVLDRIDSLCFSAPVVFHLTRYYYAS
jgi:phosphatidate cytidylyltransferase